MWGFLKELDQQDHAVLVKSLACIVFLVAGFLTWGEIALGCYLIAYFIIGWDILKEAAANLAQKRFFGETLLMSIATIGALLIEQYPEAVAVMLFYRIGEMFQDFAVEKSKKSITNLLDIRPQYAMLKTATGFKQVLPEEVKVGQIIGVKPGEKIALDGIVVAGQSSLDTKALTGESTPSFVEHGAQVLSGMIALDGNLEIEVQKTAKDSTVAKILELVQNASQKKATTENFITRFSKVYTPFVVLLALFLALGMPLVLNEPFGTWVYRALVFLVISCPCALVLSIPLSFFGGIGAASQVGVLVKGGNYLEALTKVKVIAFDKTGTLTEGKFGVTEVKPSQDHTVAELLSAVATAEQASLHPLALSVLDYCQKQGVAFKKVQKIQEQAGFGVQAFDKTAVISAGNRRLMEKIGIKTPLLAEDEGGQTTIYVAKDQVYLGCLHLADTIKPDTVATLQDLKAQGLQKLVLLTGDKKEVSQAFASQVGLDEVHAQLLPAEKLTHLSELKASLAPDEKIAFVGDGINDTPVLAQADIGIAMGALGSDAAIEAADVVLMSDEPSALVRVIKVAQKTKKIVWQNITLALVVKSFFLILGALGIATMWEAVFSDVGVTILAVLNALRLLKHRE